MASQPLGTLHDDSHHDRRAGDLGAGGDPNPAFVTPPRSKSFVEELEARKLTRANNLKANKKVGNKQNTLERTKSCVFEDEDDADTGVTHNAMNNKCGGQEMFDKATEALLLRRQFHKDLKRKLHNCFKPVSLPQQAKHRGDIYSQTTEHGERGFIKKSRKASPEVDSVIATKASFNTCIKRKTSFNHID